MSTMYEKVLLLPLRIQNEWYNINSYASSKPKEIVFEEFLKKCENTSDFLSVNESLIKEWNHDYKCRNLLRTGNNFIEIWNIFKCKWQLNDNDIASEVMLKEMELLSDNMLTEWRYKYNFDYIHIYEDYNLDLKKLMKKTKIELWEEFKVKWDINIDNYNEDMYNKMSKYTSEIECDSKSYPSDFYEYREDANYHSYDSYSLIEQYEICEDWAAARN